jgi:hypothetical protein
MIRSLLRARRRAKLLANLAEIHLEIARLATAAERIATAAESQLQRRGFRSGPPGREERDEADYLAQTDEDFALLDALEDQRRRAGREASLDEDLEDEYRGLPRGEEGEEV